MLKESMSTLQLLPLQLHFVSKHKMFICFQQYLTNMFVLQCQTSRISDVPCNDIITCKLKRMVFCESVDLFNIKPPQANTNMSQHQKSCFSLQLSIKIFLVLFLYPCTLPLTNHSIETCLQLFLFENTWSYIHKYCSVTHPAGFPSNIHHKLYTNCILCKFTQYSSWRIVHHLMIKKITF